jgi:outer membrane protein assembly factor BamD (BamD/ComL family)
VPLWLCGLLVACQGPSTSGPPDQLLARGDKAFDAKDYKLAAKYYSAIKQKHGESVQDEKATFFYAESKRLERYGGSSFKGFKDFANRYPNSKWSVAAAEAEYKLGNAYFDKTLWGFLFFKPDPIVGARVMEHMQVHYRNHSLADDALMRAGDFFIKKKKWQSARTYFKQLLAEYPRSQHVLRARFQYARALWKMSEGPDYDERLMLEARRGFRDFVAAVGAEGKTEDLADQVKSAEGEIVKINERLAKKQYRIGRFYERTKRPTSALHYYRYCLTEYPDSNAAKDCAKRAERIKAKLAAEGATESGPPPKEKETA